MFRYTSFLQVILRATTIVALFLCVSTTKAQDKNSPSTKPEPVLLTPNNVVKIKGLKGEQGKSYSTGKSDNAESKLNAPKACKSGVGVTQTKKGDVVVTRNTRAVKVEQGTIREEDLKKMPQRKAVPVANPKSTK